MLLATQLLIRLLLKSHVLVNLAVMLGDHTMRYAGLNRLQIGALHLGGVEARGRRVLEHALIRHLGILGLVTGTRLRAEVHSRVVAREVERHVHIVQVLIGGWRAWQDWLAGLLDESFCLECPVRQ